MAPTLDLIPEHLSALPGSDRLFNPYDLAQPGGDIRRANLTRYLADMGERRPRALMLFEAPGYRGCALSGIPVTSEQVMLRGVARWGLFGEGYRGTSGKPGGVSELTASILWPALEAFAPQPPLIWNTVPLHPHQPGQSQTNRTPSAAERRIGLDLIASLLDHFQFQTVMAVGRVAQGALTSLGVGSIPLRHPAQGGKSEFLRGLAEVYPKQP